MPVDRGGGRGRPGCRCPTRQGRSPPSTKGVTQLVAGAGGFAPPRKRLGDFTDRPDPPARATVAAGVWWCWEGSGWPAVCGRPWAGRHARRVPPPEHPTPPPPSSTCFSPWNDAALEPARPGRPGLPRTAPTGKLSVAPHWPAVVVSPALARPAWFPPLPPAWLVTDRAAQACGLVGEPRVVPEGLPRAPSYAAPAPYPVPRYFEV